MSTITVAARTARLAVVGLLLVSAPITWAQEENDTTAIEINGAIHSPSQIMRLVERSDLVYELGHDSLLTAESVEYQVIYEQLYVDTSEGGWEVRQYSLGDSANLLLASADGAFSAKDYGAARELYRDVLDLEPKFHFALTLVGDTYFMTKQWDSASAYFRMAMDSNFYDRHAHWFLADVLWETGDTTAAIREITLAHLLNRNHPQTLKRMCDYRADAGKPWEHWTFEPVFRMTQDSLDKHVIHMLFPSTDWLAYAMVKALWRYEPGYSDKMLANADTPYDAFMLEEREAVFCQLMMQEGEDYLGKLLENDFLDKYIIYEIVSKTDPYIMYRVPPEKLNAFLAYLEEYH